MKKCPVKVMYRVQVRPHPAQHPASAHPSSQGGIRKAQVPCRAARRASNREPARQAETQRTLAVYPMAERQRGDVIAFLEMPARGQKSSSPQKTMLAQG